MADDRPFVLVTGGTGLVGSELVRLLLDEGYPVRILRRERSSLEALGALSYEVEHVVGDLTDPWSVQEAVSNCDIIFHVAAQLTGAPPQLLNDVNVGGTRHVVNAALKEDVDRLIHTSSIAALGRPMQSERLISEETGWDDSADRSPYAKSKRDAELEVYRGIEEGLDAVLVNPGFIFGVGRSGENTRMMVDAAASGWAIAAPTGATAVVDARDVAAGLLRAYRLGDTGERYILSSENLSWFEVVHALNESFDKPRPRFTIPVAALRAIMYGVVGISKLIRKRPPLSRSIVRTMSSTFQYDNKKARMELGCSFRPFDETAAHIAQSINFTR